MALIGASTVLVVFTFPETEFNRAESILGPAGAFDPDVIKDSHLKQEHLDSNIKSEEMGDHSPAPAKRTYFQRLRLFSGYHTEESFFKLFLRPIVLLCLPPVLWATLVMSVTIGFLVAISSNFASAFSTAYGFKPWQAGLCFIASIVGSFIGIFMGGHFSDMIADFFTRRNGGIREPEMRLPAIAVSLVTGPLALILYGVGIGNGLHWMVPTLGLGLCKCAEGRG